MCCTGLSTVNSSFKFTFILKYDVVILVISTFCPVQLNIVYGHHFAKDIVSYEGSKYQIKLVITIGVVSFLSLHTANLLHNLPCFLGE